MSEASDLIEEIRKLACRERSRDLICYQEFFLSKPATIESDMLAVLRHLGD